MPTIPTGHKHIAVTIADIGEVNTNRINKS